VTNPVCVTTYQHVQVVHEVSRHHGNVAMLRYLSQANLGFEFVAAFLFLCRTPRCCDSSLSSAREQRGHCKLHCTCSVCRRASRLILNLGNMISLRCKIVVLRTVMIHSESPMLQASFGQTDFHLRRTIVYTSSRVNTTYDPTPSQYLNTFSIKAVPCSVPVIGRPLAP
jgi:hypothetical protein